MPKINLGNESIASTLTQKCDELRIWRRISCVETCLEKGESTEGWSERSLRKDKLENMNICEHCQSEGDTEAGRIGAF